MVNMGWCMHMCCVGCKEKGCVGCKESVKDLTHLNKEDREKDKAEPPACHSFSHLTYLLCVQGPCIHDDSPQVVTGRR